MYFRGVTVSMTLLIWPCIKLMLFSCFRCFIECVTRVESEPIIKRNYSYLTLVAKHGMEISLKGFYCCLDVSKFM